MKFTSILLCAIACIALFFSAPAHGELRPYPADCSKFLNCTAGGCFIQSCGPGTEFNPRIGTCDYPLQGRKDCKRH